MTKKSLLVIGGTTLLTLTASFSALTGLYRLSVAAIAILIGALTVIVTVQLARMRSQIATNSRRIEKRIDTITRNIGREREVRSTESVATKSDTSLASQLAKHEHFLTHRNQVQNNLSVARHDALLLRLDTISNSIEEIQGKVSK